jgi:ATP-dependent protease ClpP protease subunit
MVITIYGEVTNQTLMQVRQQLATISEGEAVTLRIDSPGGDLLSGLGIYEALLPYNPEVFIDGLSGSIASVIMFAGTTRNIVKTGTVAIHNAQQVIMMEQGDQNKFKEIANNLEKLSNIIVDVYENNIALDRDSIKAAMDKETFMNAQEALELGFVTNITEQSRLVAKIDNMKILDYLRNNVQGPTDAAALAPGTSNEVEAPKVENETEEEKEEEVVAFSEAQMGVLADMIEKSISAVVANQVGKEVATILNQVVSEGTPPSDPNPTYTQQDSTRNGFTAFSEWKAKLKK